MYLFFAVFDKDINALIFFGDHKVNARFQCTQSWQWRENIDCCCKTANVLYSFMKWSPMNTNSTIGSDLCNFNDEGKIMIVVVKPLLLLTLLWSVTTRLMQKLIALLDTFFDLLTKEKCLLSLLTVADGHPVVGSGYSPHNI